MSIYYEAVVGYVIIGKCATIHAPTGERVCSNNRKHRVSHTDKFCSSCGSKVDLDSKLTPTAKSFGCLGDELMGVVSDEDAAWLQGTFLHHTSERCGYSEEYDVLTLADQTSVDECGDGVVIVTGSLIAPAPEDIQRLVSIMGYTSVQVNIGVVVTVS